MCTVRVVTVCTFVRIAAQHSTFSFRFFRAPGLDLPLPGLNSVARVGSSTPVVGCTCSALIALDLRPHTGSPAIAQDLRPHSGFATVYLSGDGATSPVVGMPGGQSHPARARAATLVPSLRVGRQASGSSHLVHFQRAPRVFRAACPVAHQVRCSTPAAVTSVSRRSTTP
ncbi:hypothetical protein NDU88_005446 [Pleurodeles waltl]|uniref:Secreted protein n=1 Tax=Pleurodeles waltl TaxID=8319 RepID=A0AAV7PNN0_PLEWA|nr:hypothetical protein NDU88_005446 [Pleurodeles waltl]